MGIRAAACLAWSTLALRIVLAIAYFPIRFQLHAVPITPNAILPQNDIDILKITPTRAIAGGFLNAACPAFATLGVLIVTHQRRNMDEDHEYN
jgi:hypothetical protein